MFTNISSEQIWKDRYRKNDESYEEHIKRVSNYIGQNEDEKKSFYELMKNGLFYGAGRIMSNSGVGKSLTLNNCFTLNFVEDSIEDIFNKVKQGALTQQKGGGTGYNFSQIRPKNTPTSNDAVASGVVSFMDVFDAQTATILQGNRRGANMGVLSVRHPDIYDFISAKSKDTNKLKHFNISVLVDEEFMKAVESNSEFDLHYPVFDDKGHFITDKSKYTHTQSIWARELWDLIIQESYNTGEPGLLYYDNLNKDNNTYYCETIIATNPCSEYIAGLLHGDNIDSKDYYGACNLGSLFLHNYVKNPFTKDAYIDYDLLEESITHAVKFLDNIIDINNYPIPQFENYQKSMRTIGLGITGLADMLTMLGFKYSSDEAIEFVDYLMNNITKAAYRTSIELAKEKGSFPMLDKQKFIESNFINKHIEKDEEWIEIKEDILKYGIRNSRMISTAPTGTISMAYGNNCSSGIEPIFMLEYVRKVKMGGQSDDNIQEVVFRDYAYDLWLNTENNVVDKEVFETALEMGVYDHLKMLKTIAFHVDMSVSKTINIPEDYSFEDTKDVYIYAWKNGIKGCTIFRPNPVRQGLFSSGKEEKEEKKSSTQELRRGDWKPIADDTVYYKRKIKSGCSEINLFIGYSQEENAIQDMYMKRSASSGCDKNIETTVISMSGMLRLGGTLTNIEKAFDGIGVCPSYVSARKSGQIVSKGISCGSSILHEIQAFVKEIQGDKNELPKQLKKEIPKVNVSKLVVEKKGQSCPECGEGIESIGGCVSCIHCGWSKCN